ncbi:N-acetyltransferase 9-like [Eurytemora carolleeae]|uniref:N-acetyltransferase 9-like n=1 Tax=Eurytemora carolleeae TaxID=1294199 RepID=UPI000C77EDEF|nr:N-acetyltransferase 9-like [Eurytemora carolleeae]|eukprot:XP_023329996.1 N-acetyltransferase 9-like [Eurytemora affinis]
MRLNWNTKIVGRSLVLVPYQRSHVLKYHQWMKSEELQELTGSEPLSLEDEYEMQTSWKEDKDKCTFIILDKCKLESGLSEEDCMIGDTNLFLSQDVGCAEAEIMIADEGSRGKGFGRQAITLMLRYGIEYLNLEELSAKIKFGNLASENLFKSLGFQEVSRSEVFQETTFLLRVSQDTRTLVQAIDCTLQDFINPEE